MSYASYNTVDQYSSPSVGSSDLPIDMAEGNEANVDLIGLECDAGKDVTKEVEEVEGDYLDSKLQKRVLNFVEVLPPHTGTCVCDAIYKCLQEWSIEEKVWTITVDNASYNDSAVRLLHDSLSFHTNLPLDGKLFHIRCCAHILNILVQDGLSEIKSIIENVRDSVKYISASPQRLHSFNEICKQLQVPSKKLILDCCTRWNATFVMLSCALDFKQVFPRYQLRDPNYNCLPSNDD
ncbi:zinc finger BED domain-containing protein RICESLEEPER 2-like [Ipomoea triloba]|uniref:zinc finger BED domain-containing protein RICESLEEPER 2-like n=1 Tax=Ipomoea triloba TaxID=35885 RepID=UPI00125DB670|nr:zinc finger BED domain-containing protein RICESLEEPER 2-like [Ipomoea triloba]